jgi:hypothetical protein
MTSDRTPEAPAGDERHEQQTIVSVSRLIGLAPSLFGGLASSLAVAYFIGWRTSVEYFEAFGAGWVAPLLSPIELLQRSYSPLTALLIGMFFAVTAPVSLASNDKAIYRTDLAVGGFAVLLLSVLLVGEPYVGKRPAALAGFIASLLLAMGVGFTAVRFSLDLTVRRAAWGKRQLWFLYSIWFAVATQLPVAAGRGPGRLDADPVLSPLPVVRIGGEDWRLLLPGSDRLVIAQLFVDKKPIVRIVEANTADSIREP